LDDIDDVGNKLKIDSERLQALQNEEISQKLVEPYIPKPFTEYDKILNQQDNMRKMGSWFNRNPVLRNIIGAINPSSRSAEGAAKAGKFMLMAQKSSNKEYSAIRVAGLRINNPFKVITKGDDIGRLSNVVKKGSTEKPLWADVLQDAKSYVFTDGKSVADHVWYKNEFLPFTKEVEKVISKTGIMELKEMPKGQVYVPRYITELFNGIKNKSYPGRAYHERIFENQRVFESIEDGIKAGNNYSADVVGLLQQHYQGVLDLVSEKNFMDWIKPLGTEDLLTGLSKQLNDTRKAVNYLSKVNVLEKDKINVNTLKSIKGYSDKLGKAIEKGSSKEELDRILMEETHKKQRTLARLMADRDNEDVCWE
jgi:hypothetical protein